TWSSSSHAGDCDGWCTGDRPPAGAEFSPKRCAAAVNAVDGQSDQGKIVGSPALSVKVNVRAVRSGAVNRQRTVCWASRSLIDTDARGVTVVWRSGHCARAPGGAFGARLRGVGRSSIWTTGAVHSPSPGGTVTEVETFLQQCVRASGVAWTAWVPTESG